MFTSNQIRERFLDFFSRRDHVVLPSAPLVVPDDTAGRNATLFTVAGMQPLMPYLLGKEHPSGQRLASSQKCLRTVDIDDVGDNTHNTFFEMLGNWSLGDYFKEKAIAFSWEFLTDKEEGLGLDPARMYVTVFAGNDDVPTDKEAVEIWKQFIPEDRIYFRDSKDNWWTAGANSPAGPSTEMFYDLTGELGSMTPQEFAQADEDQKVVEIWNDVFMAYRLENGQIAEELPSKNVDTGAGLERLTAVVQGVRSIFETDMFAPVLEYLKQQSPTYSERAARIVSDHLRTAVMLLSEDLRPSNTDRGYILRRLLRRSDRFLQELGLEMPAVEFIVDHFVHHYAEIYPVLAKKRDAIIEQIKAEHDKFAVTLAKGIKAIESGERDVFVLFTTFGFPPEMSIEVAKEMGIELSKEGFEQKMADHQALSRTAGEQKFKGGLADHQDQTVKHHTAHHLLLAALQQVLGKEVKQRGSNINEQRLRIDFSFPRKVTKEELDEVQSIVNDAIAQNLSVIKKTMPKQEAELLGAEMEFGHNYPDMVDVYFIQDSENKVFSKEFCGGPHVAKTGELGEFTIMKESASSAGVRRIKAKLV